MGSGTPAAPANVLLRAERPLFPSLYFHHDDGDDNVWGVQARHRKERRVPGRGAVPGRVHECPRASQQSRPPTTSNVVWHPGCFSDSGCCERQLDSIRSCGLLMETCMLDIKHSWTCRASRPSATLAETLSLNGCMCRHVTGLAGLVRACEQRLIGSDSHPLKQWCDKMPM